MKHKILTASVLLLTIAILLCACAKDPSDPASAQDVTQPQEKTQAPMEEFTEPAARDDSITTVNDFFDRAQKLCEQNEKSVRFSSDAWSQEEIEGDRIKYTLLGSSVVLSVIYDSAQNQVVAVSASTDVNNYSDEAIRADMILYTSVLATVMSGKEDKAVADFCSDFEDVISAGVEKYADNIRLSIIPGQEDITLSAEITA